ncbi:OsmC/Ohr family [Chytridium lagenaria]|nr:OsmC/Ohr family [Chytridium lagenaria]
MFMQAASRIVRNSAVRQVVQRRGIVKIKPIYTAEATADALGRGGSVKGAEGFTAKLAYPKALGGFSLFVLKARERCNHANPEILFAAGYSACYVGALNAVAGKLGVKIPKDTTVTAKVHIGPPVDAPGFALAVDLDVKLPGLDAESAKKVVAAAHDACPYSRATKGNIEVNINLV